MRKPGYSVDEAPDASDTSETLGYFAVFRGCVHAFVVRHVLKRIACFSGFSCTGTCAVWAPLIGSKTRANTVSMEGRKNKSLLRTLPAFYKSRFLSDFITIPVLRIAGLPMQRRL